MDHFLSVTVIAVHPHVQFSPYTVLDRAAAGVHKALISQTPFQLQTPHPQNFLLIMSSHSPPATCECI